MGDEAHAATSLPIAASTQLFAGAGEMRALCRSFDWAATALGPVDTWSHSLRTTVGIMLASRHPMFLWWGPELVQLYNDAYRPSFGGAGRHERALGASGRDFWPEIWDIIGPQIAQVMSGGPATWHEDQLVPIERNGRIEDVWWTYGYSPVRDDDGTIGGTLVVCQETTGRVRAEGAVRTSEAKYRALFDAMDEGFCIIEVLFDGDGSPRDYRFLEANPAFVQQTGLVAAVGRTILELAPTQERHWFERYGDVALTGKPIRFDAPATALGRWYDVHAFRIGAAAEHRVAVLFGDVSAAKRAEAERVHLVAALSAERERLRSVILHAPAPMALLVGPEHRFELVNDAYKRISGGGRDVTGLTPAEAFPELAGSGIYELFDQVFTTGEAWYGPETLCRYDRDGTGLIDTWFDLRFEPMRDASGTVIAILNFAVDQTGQVLARRDLERLYDLEQCARAAMEEAYRAAEAANRAKGEFLAVMSHELRTPLNAIGGYAELMEMGIRGPVSTQQAEDLRRIQASQRHLLGLINEVLNYTKLETGTVQFDFTGVPVREALLAAEALVAPQARAKGLALSVGDCAVELTAHADPEKVRQILVNLLSNAVKFTNAHGGRDGSITLSAAGGGDGVLIRVRDSGIGIPADKLETIFDPFVQVRADLTRPHEGTGLGLAISRDLARRMGGDLVVESVPDEGSTFTLTLPGISG